MISEWLNGRLGGLRTGLWRRPDFVKLWAGETISVFGSLIGRTALHFTAILVLDARPFEVAALLALGIVRELISGPFAGGWLDRQRLGCRSRCVRRRRLARATVHWARRYSDRCGFVPLLRLLYQTHHQDGEPPRPRGGAHGDAARG